MILVAGAILVLSLMGQPARERQRAMEEVRVGMPAAAAIDAIGEEPMRCPSDSLSHLRAGFPEGWPDAAKDVAVEQLEAATAERWVFPIGGTEAGCSFSGERTEIGVDGAGAVLWSVAAIGRTAIVLPPDLAPAGAP